MEGEPDVKFFLKFWKVSGNPDTAVFYKDKLIIPCGCQGVLMRK